MIYSFFFFTVSLIRHGRTVKEQNVNSTGRIPLIRLPIFLLIYIKFLGLKIICNTGSIEITIIARNLVKHCCRTVVLFAAPTRFLNRQKQTHLVDVQFLLIRGDKHTYQRNP